MLKTACGLVLRETAVGESDKLLTVLTPEYGKLLLSAKGVRSMRSKNIPLCRLFTYGNFEFYEKNGHCWLSGGSVIDSFYELNSDIEGFALAAYVTDVATELSGEGENGEDILRLSLNTLYAITKKLRPYNQIKGAFELYAASHAGFMPDISGCRECNKRAASYFYLDVMNGNMLCSECLGKQQKGYYRETDSGVITVDRYEQRSIILPMSPAVTAAVNYAVSAPVRRLFSFELKEKEDIKDFSKVGETYLSNHLERGFETLSFYHSVSED